MSEEYERRIAALEREVAALKKQINAVDDLASGYFSPLAIVLDTLMREHPQWAERWINQWKSASQKFRDPALRDPNEPLDTDEGLAVQKSLYDLFHFVRTQRKND